MKRMKHLLAALVMAAALSTTVNAQVVVAMCNIAVWEGIVGMMGADVGIYYWRWVLGCTTSPEDLPLPAGGL
jgi:hypothetical protein